MTHAMMKGANVPLDATAVRAVLRWTPGPGIPDVDASALLVGSDGRVRNDEDFVFYNQVRHPSGLVRKLSMKRIPEGLTDTIVADLSHLDASVDRVVIAASLDLDSFEGATFAHVRDLRILLYDATAASDEPLAHFDVKPETGEETAVICGEVYRRGEGWKFRAVGQGYPTGLIGLATQFGISVDESESPEAPAATASGPASPASAPPAPAPAQEPATQAVPPTASPAQPFPQPPAQPAYGYPHAVPPPPQAQPTYGYPQPASGQPAYGYPQPAAAAAHAPDPNFRLPPQGPQFIRG
ncbi:TerD family protein [Streptomyces sp. NBC_00237]|uniref:TerD family protein n=1 Tax=Streptomyces sp. NBC_00237 TaxID=2975687 RepID=UPI0022558B6F|nr:TerD family protein [Streptomyces sp. NBC_00237]MCX5201444.1 TerD family protein [Streptomyces sp. NBC_00237]